MPLPHLHQLLRLLPRPGEKVKFALEALAWMMAVLWCVRTRTLMRRLGEVPDLTDVRWDLCPLHAPGLVVVVPARNEAGALPSAMQTLLEQDYPWLRIVAVDDRSTDDTGALLERIAAEHPEKLSVLHLTDVAEGWIAKTFAMETAAVRSRSEWLLFTDADVWFSPSILRRAIAYAEMTRADHLVVAPSAVLRTWGETYFTGFLTVLALWVVRPWRVADPTAYRDAVGAGAFNLIRRDALEELGGLAPQRLAIVEDLMLGRRVRAAGMRQRLAFAPGLVLVHWASGVRGLVRGMTKNLFAMVNFRLWHALFLACAIVLLYLTPLAGLAWYRTTLPSLVILACLGVQYRSMGELTGIASRWVWLAPLGAVTFLWAILRSVAVTTWHGGVRWRETFYPLRELRRHNDPMQWEREARSQDYEQRRTIRQRKLSRWLRTARHRAKPVQTHPRPR